MVTIHIGIVGALFCALGLATTEEDLLTALSARARRADHILLVAEWRTFRAPRDSDPADRSQWTALRPGVDPCYDLVYDIARPDYRLTIADIHDSNLTAQYAWVKGELTQRSIDEPGKPGEYTIVGHHERGLRRGRVFLTPMELEVFDLKEPLHWILANSRDLSVRDESGLVRAECNHPNRAPFVVRATFDPARDYAPVTVEQYVHPAGNRQPMTYRMDVQSTIPLGGTYIVGEAIIVNANPNVLGDSVVLSHFRVSEARIDTSVTAVAFKLTHPETNVVVIDTIRNIRRKVGVDGQSDESVQLDPELLQQQQQLWSEGAAQLAKGARERTRRPLVFALFVGVAAGAAVALALVIRVRQRRRIGS